MDEFELIERYFARGARRAVVGIGDDCAVIRITPGHEIAMSTDMLVEGRHFLAGTDPERLGHKTLAVNLSDCAANGAVPRYALLAMALPHADDAWLAAFSRGLFALADRFDVELIGGDTTRGPLNLCVTIIGEVPAGASLLRSGARVGDLVWVSGRLGSAAMGLALLQGDESLSSDDRRRAIDALETPEPRVALGLALRGIATAAIDVSDGLVGDLGHILERSHVGAEVFIDAIPCEPWLRAMRSVGPRAMPAETRALSDNDRTRVANRAPAGSDRTGVANRALLAGGDDYELCFTAAASSESAVHAAGRSAGVEVTAIGRIVQGNSLRVIDQAGKVMPMNDVHAFDHFR